MIRIHDVVNDRCKHCGAFKPGPESTCIPRLGDRPVSDVGRRVMGIEDFDFLNTRIAEIRKAQGTILAGKEEGKVEDFGAFDLGDCCI